MLYSRARVICRPNSKTTAVEAVQADEAVEAVHEVEVTLGGINKKKVDGWMNGWRSSSLIYGGRAHFWRSSYRKDISTL